MLVALTFSSKASFKVGDLYYNIITGTNTVEVVNNNNYSNLTSVTIPSEVTYESVTYSVTNIDEIAFNGCSNLASVAFAEGSKLASIGEKAFANCTGLTSITIPDSVTSIGEYAFDRCDKLATVSFAEGTKLTSIGKNAFSYCLSLIHI